MLDKNYWQDLLAIAAKNKAKMGPVFRKAVASSMEGFRFTQLETPLASGDLYAVEALIDWNKFEVGIGAYKPLLIENLNAAGTATAEWYSLGMKTQTSFDLVNPYAVDWINNHSAALVANIGGNSRQAIREILRDGFENGLTTREMGTRIAQHIGLDPTRSKALLKFRESLAEGGLSTKEIESKVSAYSGRLLRDRGLGIANNESLTASSQGFYLETRQAVERGILSPAKYEGYRIVTPDDRICPRCQELEGEARRLPDGRYPSTGSEIAMVHNSCRCCEGIRSTD
jgi:hypothetical protein